ncbi:ABC transporter permease [Pseudonocardia sp. TRM90224]|uniref:ABC transporter permease n=1 Tax=Pseudonocardia sp. TRM90224 TaxID=2812678 RepID=UPI001E34A073|nr:ABC transporter permease [Pseudonocardia sp. TRM90224]
MNLLPFRLGLRRGLTAFITTTTTREGMVQLVIFNAVPLAVLILNRDEPLPGVGVALSASMLPGMLTLITAFGVQVIAYYLSSEREDGTLLRVKAMPNGMFAYVVGLATVSSLDALVSVLLVFVPAILFIVPGVPIATAGFWLGLLGFLLLGLLACLPLGLLIGSVVRNPRTIGGVGFVGTMGLAFLSGLFFPAQALWGWVQVVVQVLPLYWLGHGMRWVFLPTEAAALEIGGVWRIWEAVGVLGLWAGVALVLGPVLLRRMARRESGSAVESRRQHVLQRT